ncbi:Retrovirus-related Pol polyprotein from transposon RE1 [Vitis vinifera]|uniref:Retrovirus-related Pol polyprotein from transposon RE1 n=1 Tax=Vitis vinifera TaxID=29760 RepID=A0A438BLL4_VITVI|nr:Retrovirus-related Pol polyprotein from transposon RE1 [Vitis vinifera]
MTSLDQLLLNALIGSLSPTIIPFIAQAKTAKEAWTILANTYAKPSRGRIKQVKTKLKNPTKGSQNVTEYLHFVKTCADELAILGVPLDPEDLTDKILDRLGDDYKELVCAVQARDTSITFDELHEKLLSFEASAPAITSSETSIPITANLITTQKALFHTSFLSPKQSEIEESSLNPWQKMICYRPGCDDRECHVLLPEGVRIGERTTYSLRESGWSCSDSDVRSVSSGGGVPTPCTRRRPPCDVWHRTFHPDDSHPEFCSADIPPECLTSGILLRRHSIWIFRIRRLTPDGRRRRFNFPGQTYPDPLKALTRRVSQPFCTVSCQSNSKDFSSEDERLGSSSLGVKKSGCISERDLVFKPIKGKHLYHTGSGNNYMLNLQCEEKKQVTGTSFLYEEPEPSDLKLQETLFFVINFVDYSLNQGAPAGHESADTPTTVLHLDLIKASIRFVASKDIQPRDLPHFKCFPFNPLPLHPHPPTTQLLLCSHELTLLRIAHHQTRAGYSTVAPLIMSQLI